MADPIADFLRTVAKRLEGEAEGQRDEAVKLVAEAEQYENMARVKIESAAAHRAAADKLEAE